MTSRLSDLQSDSDLDSIRNSCDVFMFWPANFDVIFHIKESQNHQLHLFAIRSDGLMMKTIANYPYPDSVMERNRPLQKQESSLSFSLS